MARAVVQPGRRRPTVSSSCVIREFGVKRVHARVLAMVVVVGASRASRFICGDPRAYNRSQYKRAAYGADCVGPAGSACLSYEKRAFGHH